jgi:hypothetical protein
LSLSIWTLTPIRRKVLVIGPRSDGQLVEVIILSLADDRELVIHAMMLRPTFHNLLRQGDL